MQFLKLFTRQTALLIDLGLVCAFTFILQTVHCERVTRIVFTLIHGTSLSLSIAPIG
jgi:hypothetical protein